MTPTDLEPERVETIVLACCSLHKFLISHKTFCAIYNHLEETSIQKNLKHTLCPLESGVNNNSHKNLFH